MATATVTGLRPLTLPISPLTPLRADTKPTVTDIRQLRSELYENASSVRSRYGGGQHGLLGMLMPAEEYAELSPDHAFDIEEDGPDIPELDGDDPEELRRLYELHLADYNRAMQFRLQIKNLMLAAIPRKYIARLRHPRLQFTNVNAAEILDHMVTTYGKIRPRDLERNLVDIATPWNPDTDIETVFNHGDLCREIAEEGGNPISDASYVLILIKIFRESGVFPMEIREWNRRAEDDKTVDDCIEFFTEANDDRLEETLQKGLGANTVVKTKPTEQATKPPIDGNWLYCWTHGLCQHSGATCKSPAENHKSDATLNTPMGGSNQIRFPGRFGKNNNNNRNGKGKQGKARPPIAEAVPAQAAPAIQEDDDE
jgi:hypothetical protein